LNLSNMANIRSGVRYKFTILIQDQNPMEPGKLCTTWLTCGVQVPNQCELYFGSKLTNAIAYPCSQIFVLKDVVVVHLTVSPNPDYVFNARNAAGNKFYSHISSIMAFE
jgi:hypothetical protein